MHRLNLLTVCIGVTYTYLFREIRQHKYKKLSTVSSYGPFDHHYKPFFHILAKIKIDKDAWKSVSTVPRIFNRKLILRKKLNHLLSVVT